MTNNVPAAILACRSGSDRRFGLDAVWVNRDKSWDEVLAALEETVWGKKRKALIFLKWAMLPEQRSKYELPVLIEHPTQRSTTARTTRPNRNEAAPPGEFENVNAEFEPADNDPDLASLRAAYDRAGSIIGRDRAESFKVAAEVERLRRVHRPPDVRVVLLAESHVWTSSHETSSRVSQPDGVETGFARFVYCLGYGEPSLVRPSVLPNPGTRQFWSLFHDAVRGPDVALGAISKTERDPTARAQAKLTLLREMNDAGIWLVDACVTALYRPGPVRLAAGPIYRQALTACWEAHIGPLVTASSPSAVLIVGKGVAWAVGGLVEEALPNAEVIVIEQPNARGLDSEARQNNSRTVFELCSRHRLSARDR